MNDAVVHRDLTDDERQALVDRAFNLERRITSGVVQVHSASWDLAEALHEFHEGGYWSLLGYDTLEEFLAQPNIGMKRRQFFRLTQLWRDLVVTHRVPTSALKELEPAKVAEVLPAVNRGAVKVEEALSDVKAMPARDLRDKYKQANPTRTPLDAEQEPERKMCPTCGSWVDASELPDEEDDDDGT